MECVEDIKGVALQTNSPELTETCLDYFRCWMLFKQSLVLFIGGESRISSHFLLGES